ncbi:MAG: hypothetical protein K1X94_31660 [Sandaracinaceae bacterium]|nr:hypothetical protein [Sandaracinaceae bacterium]
MLEHPLVEPELKATVLRAYVRWLEEHGLADDVRRDVGPELAALMDTPPPPTQWLRARETSLVLVEAVAKRHGLAMVRRMSREAAMGPIYTMLRPIVEGVLRLAAGPDTVVAKLPFVLGASARGISFDVCMSPAKPAAPKGQGEAVLTMRTSALRETRASAEAWCGGIQALLELAHTSPTVEVLEIVAEPTGSVVKTRIAWDRSAA